MKLTERIESKAKDRKLKPKPDTFIQRPPAGFLERIDAIAEHLGVSRNQLVNACLEEMVSKFESENPKWTSTRKS